MEDFIDEERVPLIDQYENNDDSVYEDTQTTTSFTQEDKQRQQELNIDINALERGFNVKYLLKSEVDLGVSTVIYRSKNLQENL